MKNGRHARAHVTVPCLKAWDKAVDDVDETDQRPKWAGLFHRRKGHYGRYMMRLKIPNGVVTSDQTRYLASVVRSCGGGHRGIPPFSVLVRALVEL